MESTKLISLYFVLVCTLNTLDLGYASPGTTTLCDKEDTSVTFLRKYASLIEGIKQNILSGKKESDNKCGTKSIDCAEELRSGHTMSGVYTIWPKNKIINGSVEVYCDMDTDGGGWTVIQRRGDYGRPEDDFFRDWESYKKGFGDIREDFWLGNDLIFAISNQMRYSIRIELCSFQDEKRYALYDNFWIEDEVAQYRLHISNYSGDAYDCLATEHDDMKFSTKDRDNDRYGSECAKEFKGAWWFNACQQAHLNGPYLDYKNVPFFKGYGVRWANWYSLKTAEMKIRPKYLQSG